MNRIVEFFQYPGVAKRLVESLPIGLLLMDDQGRIQSANNVIAGMLGVRKQVIKGNLIGNALGCLNAFEGDGTCSSAKYCKGCEVRNLGLAAIDKNKTQRARTSLQLVKNGQVKDVELSIIAVPIELKRQRFSIFAIEAIPGLPEVSVPSDKKRFKGIVGQHPSMKELFKTIRQVARTDVPVLLQGETGTGKELAALAIHKLSSRAQNYFVPINCGALPEGLHESELFGHVKGAFTGAIRDKKGRFELAHGGTLFLDEVGELRPYMQVKLLRVLQDGKFQPVGSEKTLHANVRIISATNKELEKEVASGRFRKDLYYRLSALPISLPPLRERCSDIPIIADYFLKRYGKEFFCEQARLSRETVSVLTEYDWPGNVRELQNTIQFALSKCLGSIIEPSHLPKSINLHVNKPFAVRHRQPKLKAIHVAEALKKADGNKSRAAELLNVSRSTLYRFFASQEKDPAKK